MTLWYTQDEALNYPKIPKEWVERTVTGLGQVGQFLSGTVMKHRRRRKRTCTVAFDGFLGIEWENIISRIKDSLKNAGLKVETIDVLSFYKSSAEIEQMIKPCLANDPNFGSVFGGKLRDFFSTDGVEALENKIKHCRRRKGTEGNNGPDVLICYGPGALLSSLRELYDFTGYVDITREELLKRFENQTVFSLGAGEDKLSLELVSRRLSYVDYQVLGIHKKYILKHVDWYLEANNTDKIKLIPRHIYDEILATVAQYPFRVQPIYIPRIWGGKYMSKIRKLPFAACAFCLEVVAPMQNLRISLGKTVIKIPFLNLVWNQPVRVVGYEVMERFGEYFPFTANYDDTYQGGSLAIQVHPNGRYMRKKFNEIMRHDEAYYAVKVWPGARTYHGLKQETDLKVLHQICKRAEKEEIPFDENLYINSWPSQVGDLYLLPAGTIHASGANQLVLELDMDGTKTGTEYTFHLYDYLRPDLQGKMREIHLDHSFNVIRSHRRTRWVAEHLKQPPLLLRSGEGWAEYLLGKRNDMYYQINRLEFRKKIDDDTRGRFHILTLVEGEGVLVQSQEFPERQYQIHYTETVIVPACLGRYSVINTGNSFCKLTKSLLKESDAY